MLYNSGEVIFTLGWPLESHGDPFNNEHQTIIIMDKADLGFLWDYLWLIQEERFALMKGAIHDAIGKGIHVEINVNSEPGIIMAWELWDFLGFPQGSSEFTHVCIDNVGTPTLWSQRKGLSIAYASIAPPRIM